MKSMINKAIIFDMDGTIINTEEVWKKAKDEMHKILGIETPLETYHKFLSTLSGMSLKQEAVEFKKFFRLTCTEKTIMGLVIEQANLLFSHSVNFIEGFEAFANKLQSYGIPIALATNTNIEHLMVITKTVGLDRFFGKHLYSMAHALYKPKPNPAVFLYTARQLGIHPDQCIVFEDSLVGFQAARAAGMKCIAIKNKNNVDLLDRVHGAISNYHEAEAVLDDMF